MHWFNPTPLEKDFPLLWSRTVRSRTVPFNKHCHMRSLTPLTYFQKQVYMLFLTCSIKQHQPHFGRGNNFWPTCSKIPSLQYSLGLLSDTFQTLITKRKAGREAFLQLVSKEGADSHTTRLKRAVRKKSSQLLTFSPPGTKGSLGLFLVVSGSSEPRHSLWRSPWGVRVPTGR